MLLPSPIPSMLSFIKCLKVNLLKVHILSYVVNINDLDLIQ